LLALGALALGALIVPELAPTDPRTIGDVLERRLVPPLGYDRTGDWHLLGTDKFGRDIFVRMMLAARLSLLVGIAGSLLAGGVGIGLGALAAPPIA
jgi:peptide/nickel transport system permease protein